MVTNHGLAVLVSDSPFFGPISESINPQRGVERYALLGKRHGVVNVVLPIYRFFESLRDQPARFRSKLLIITLELGYIQGYLPAPFSAIKAQTSKDNIAKEKYP